MISPKAFPEASATVADERRRALPGPGQTRLSGAAVLTLAHPQRIHVEAPSFAGDWTVPLLLVGIFLMALVAADVIVGFALWVRDRVRRPTLVDHELQAQRANTSFFDQDAVA